RPGVTALLAATLLAGGGFLGWRAESLCGEIPPQVLRYQPADLNCQRGAHAVPETARGGRSDQGVEEPTESRGLSRRFHALLEGHSSPKEGEQSHHIALCLVAYWLVERERLDQGCTWRQLKRRLLLQGRQLALPALERVRAAA